MAFRTLGYRFRADGSQFEATTRRMGQSVDGVAAKIRGWQSALTGTVAALAGVLAAIDEIADRAESVERALDLGQGGATDEGRALVAGLQGAGFTTEIATSAAAATLGRTGFAAGSLEQRYAAQIAASFERAGGDAGDLYRTADIFGITDDIHALTEFAQLSFAGAGAQDASLREIVAGVRALAPAATQLGLDQTQALQLALDAERIGVSPAALNLPLQSALTRQAEGGGDALDYLRGIEQRIVSAASEEAALAVAAPVFGSRGALLVTRGARSGRFGFSEEALASGHLAGLPGLGAVEATTQEQYEALLDRGGIGGGFLAAAGQIPGIGHVTSAAARTTLRVLPDQPAAPSVVVVRDSTARGIAASQASSDDAADGRTVGIDIDRVPTR